MSILSSKEQKNIEEIEAAKDRYNRACELLGDREPMHKYDSKRGNMLHTWGFGAYELNNRVYLHMFHRTGAPCMFSDRADMARGEFWQQFGAVHRLDGPAFTDIRGRQEWWFYGIAPISWRVCQRYLTCPKEEMVFLILKNTLTNRADSIGHNSINLERVVCALGM